MKSPAEYLRGRAIPAPLDAEPVVAMRDAEEAIREALADAERYKERLVWALRRARTKEVPMMVASRTDVEELPAAA